MSEDARIEKLEAFSAKNKFGISQDATMQMLDGSSLYRLAWRKRMYRNFITTDDWQYAEVGFKARGTSGLARMRKQEIWYATMSIKLPRKLPNVIFDSTEHQKKQFRIVFDNKQLISLEGNFNKYFATYFGFGYTIDDLSFITPEVMLALIEASKYDIEIIHNRLLLFGALSSDPAAQITDMAAKLSVINDKLLHNILTYRDERVPYDKGRLVVARSGMFLTYKPYSFRGWLIVFVVGFFFVAMVLFALMLLVASVEPS